MEISLYEKIDRMQIKVGSRYTGSQVVDLFGKVPASKKGEEYDPDGNDYKLPSMEHRL